MPGGRHMDEGTQAREGDSRSKLSKRFRKVLPLGSQDRIPPRWSGQRKSGLAGALSHSGQGRAESRDEEVRVRRGKTRDDSKEQGERRRLPDGV